jgi:hypothetical protein
MYTPVSSGTLLPRTVQNQMQTLGQNSVQINKIEPHRQNFTLFPTNSIQRVQETLTPCSEKSASMI